MLVVSIVSPIIAWLILGEVLANGPVSYVFGNWPTEIGIEYRIDVLNALLLALITSVAAIIAPFAGRSVSAPPSMARSASSASSFVFTPDAYAASHRWAGLAGSPASAFASHASRCFTSSALEMRPAR